MGGSLGRETATAMGWGVEGERPHVDALPCGLPLHVGAAGGPEVGVLLADGYTPRCRALTSALPASSSGVDACTTRPLLST